MADLTQGMVVAIVAAVRTRWKDDGNGKDELYFWRNAMSNIWYSSEVTGTIIVQCIPVLRPLFRNFRTSSSSSKVLPSSTINQGLSKFGRDIKDWSTSGALTTQNSSYTVECWADENRLVTAKGASRKGGDTVELATVVEDTIKILTWRNFRIKGAIRSGEILECKGWISVLMLDYGHCEGKRALPSCHSQGHKALYSVSKYHLSVSSITPRQTSCDFDCSCALRFPLWRPTQKILWDPLPAIARPHFVRRFPTR